MRFRISVNAIQRKGQGGVRNIPFESGKDSEFYRWLEAKLSGGLSDIEIVNHTRSVLGVDRKGSVRGSKAIQVDTVDGIANVVSSESLAELVLKGVGRAKSYGCGLLSVQALG